MRRSLPQKQNRTFQLLLGILEPDVFESMQKHGFSNEVHDHGMRLLMRTASLKMVAPAPTAGAFDELHAFDRKWFPIVSASLAAHFPSVHDRIFRGFARFEGTGVALSLSEMHARLSALAGSEDPTDRAAWALLESRGFDRSTLAALATALERAMARPAPPAVSQADRDAAEEALWSYYLEWSRIARAAGLTKSQLRRLGFQTGKRSEQDDAVDTPPPTVTAQPDAVPAQPGAAPAAPAIGAGPILGSTDTKANGASTPAPA